MVDLLTPEQQQNFARQRLGLQSTADLNRQRLGEDFGLAQGLLGRQLEQNTTDAGDQMASNGLFQSGIRINQQGNILRDYNENLGQLNLNRSRGLEDITRGLTTGLGDIDFSQAQAIADATRQQAAAAQQRAMLEAQARAQAVAPPQYPQPVIALPTLPQLPMFQSYDNGPTSPNVTNTQAAIRALQNSGNYTHITPTTGRRYSF